MSGREWGDGTGSAQNRLDDVIWILRKYRGEVITPSATLAMFGELKRAVGGLDDDDPEPTGPTFGDT